MLSILSTFRDKLIPWAEDDLAQRLIVARPVMKKAFMPDGVQLTRRKISGKRVVLRDKRIYANHRLFRADWPEAGMHELEAAKLICITSGYADFQAGEYIISCSAGHFILLPPHIACTYSRPHLEFERKQQGFCEIYQFLLHHDSVQCWPCRSIGPKHENDPAENYLVRQHQAVQLFQLFQEEAQKIERDSPEVCRYLLLAFLTVMLQEFIHGRYLQMISNVQIKSEAQGNIEQKIRQYIRSHLNEHLTLEVVARHLYMSPSRLTRQVRRESGCTFGEILTDCRISEAKVLLRETEWTANTISGLVGFKSPTYFTGLFKSQVGCSPGVFREGVQKPTK